MREEERADLISHLSELRARIIRAAIYAALGTTIVWVFFEPVYQFLLAPISRPLEAFGGSLTVRALLEGLLVKVEIAFVGGLILASPFIIYEVWGFVAPGLTRTERRTALPLIPIAPILFLMGVTMGYLMTGLAVRVLLSYIPPETQALLTLNETVLLMLKFYLAFGLGFQLPIVIVLLAKIGLVDSAMLVRRWREAIIAVFILAGIITPTWDPITMTICAMPMLVLYWATVGAVKLIERRQRKNEDESLAG